MQNTFCFLEETLQSDQPETSEETPNLAATDQATSSKSKATEHNSSSTNQTMFQDKDFKDLKMRRFNFLAFNFQMKEVKMR